MDDGAGVEASVELAGGLIVLGGWVPGGVESSAALSSRLLLPSLLFTSSSPSFAFDAPDWVDTSSSIAPDERASGFLSSAICSSSESSALASGATAPGGKAAEAA